MLGRKITGSQESLVDADECAILKEGTAIRERVDKKHGLI